MAGNAKESTWAAAERKENNKGSKKADGEAITLSEAKENRSRRKRQNGRMPGKAMQKRYKKQIGRSEKRHKRVAAHI